ncbi:hypothetical protein KY331_05155 [Candidatus Woesearchaeota archaeon]|nr:hypothetical protein [Candidatus Woesearchaeota archaeon]
MVDQRLIDYVKKELAAGYKAEAIRTYLINYGYNAADVDAAIRATAAKPAVVPAAGARKIPILPIVGGILGVLFIVMIVMIFFTGKKEVEVVSVVTDKIDLKVSMLSSNIRQAESVQFNIILNSLDGQDHDVGLVYEVVDSVGSPISQREDFIAVTNRIYEQKTIDLPSNIEPGSYSIVATGRFDSEEVKSSVRFAVLSAGAEAREVVEFAEVECPVCEDNDPCTDEQCSSATNYECVHFPISPCCGNLKCESYEAYENCPTDCSPSLPAGAAIVLTLTEITQTARNYATTDLSGADSYCKGLPDVNQRDSCFYTVSQTAKQSRFCDPIFSELKRDNCYSDYALAGDFSICDKLTNVYMKESCYELEDASKNPGLR